MKKLVLDTDEKIVGMETEFCAIKERFSGVITIASKNKLHKVKVDFLPPEEGLYIGVAIETARETVSFADA